MQLSFRPPVMVAAGALAVAIGVGTAGPIARLRAADEKPGAPAQRGSRQPGVGVRLRPGPERELKWGQRVDGLRAALVLRPSPDEPRAGDMPDLYLVVQNLSDEPVRLRDTAAAPRLGELSLKLDGKTQMSIVVKGPTLEDVVLLPGEVAFLLMFPADSKGPDGRTTGSIIAEGTLGDPHQTLVAKMQIEDAPAGAWTGKLVTGETSGAAAATGLDENLAPRSTRPRP